jgi:hypothetical protein
MATLDFTPLFRSSVGFDRLPTLLSHALERDEGGYPTYNKRRADKTSTASSWRSPASARTTLKSSSSTIDCVCAASSKTLPDRRSIRNGICRSGLVAVAAVRLVPIAPFTLVNMVAGACRIPIVAYLAGTALGLLPGLLAMSALGHQIFRFIVDPNPADFALLIAAALLWLALIIAGQALAARVRGVAH